MRLRDLTASELADVAARRERVRKDLVGRDEPWVPSPEAIVSAPFMDSWELRLYPGTDRPCLRGLVWGHPRYGDTVVNTSPITHGGPGWVITEGSGRLYVLGRDAPEPVPSPVLSSRRGAYRPPLPPAPSTGTFDDLPDLEGPTSCVP